MPNLAMHSPMGPLTLHEEDGAIVTIGWGWSTTSEETGLLGLARDQLREFFDGERTDFSLPLNPAGTTHQRNVWSAMRRIPFGETQTYGDLARTIGSGPRAVGGACGRNPIPIVIPCHRVVGGNGKLTGYSGGDGLGSKRYLLDLETRTIA